MIASKRIRLVEKETYAVDLEYSDGLAILHLPSVSKFTKSIYLDMRIVLEDISQFIGDIGYQALYVAIDPKDQLLNKFVSKLGFNFLGVGEGLAVYQYKD